MDKFISPDWYPLISAAATLLLTVLARKGYNVPIISALLTWLIGRPPGPTPAPTPMPPVVPVVPGPATPLANPFLNAILDAIRKKLLGVELVGYNVEAVADNPSKLTVTVFTAPK